MYENIRVTRPNFCIGPQVGSFCYVDDTADPVVMHVKNEQGDLLRTYDFSPQDILKPGPIDWDVVDLHPPQDDQGYYPPEFVSIKYVGPRDQNLFFDGAVFFTLEKRASYYRPFYDEVGDVAWAPEYSSCVIRKWVLDSPNSRLILANTITKNSDDQDWYDVTCFAVKSNVLAMTSHSANTSGLIEVATTSGINKYDTLMLGPSTDTDNVGEVEEIYVHKVVDNNKIEIRTYGGLQPPLYDYMIGDGVTSFNEIYLFCKDRPRYEQDTVDEVVEDVMAGYLTGSGTLFMLDPANYGAVIDRHYSGIYHEAASSTWNNFYNTVSFTKDTTLLHLDLQDYEISRAQNIALYNPLGYVDYALYDLDTKDETIYKLMDAKLQRDDQGRMALTTWTTYNFNEDSMLPYTFSQTMYVNKRVLIRQGVSYIEVIIRDQYGVGLLGKNIFMTIDGDNAALFTPLDGMLISDGNGRASIRYDAGSHYHDRCEITAKVDGSSSVYGSIYILSSTYLTQLTHLEQGAEVVSTVPPVDGSVSVATKGHLLRGGEWGEILYDGGVIFKLEPPQIFPGDRLPPVTPEGDYDWSQYNKKESWPPLVTMVKEPAWHFDVKENPLADTSNSVVTVKTDKLTLCTENPIPNITGSEENYLGLTQTELYTKEQSIGEHNISQNFISRHLSYGHLAEAAIDQYVFVQEARPAMWSVKNNVDTDYWIRLRPFASDLNPATLVIRLREVSYEGDTGYINITDKGTITMFDAGGGILGIDFIYVPIKPFHHNALVYVDIEVYDTSPIPNKIILDYWFQLIQDYKAPYIANKKPDVEAFNVNIDTDITFDLIDVGEGVDISTLEVYVNNRIVEFTYLEYEPGNYHVTCDLPYSFHFGQTVYIVVDVKDRSDNANRLFDGWKFYCIDSTGPWINLDNTYPKTCIEGAKRDQGVQLQIYAIDDTGIEYDSIKLEVGGKYRNVILTPIVYRLN